MQNPRLNAISAKRMSRAKRNIAMNVAKGLIAITANSIANTATPQKAKRTWQLIDRFPNTKNAISIEARQGFEAWQVENLEARYFEKIPEERV